MKKVYFLHKNRTPIDNYFGYAGLMVRVEPWYGLVMRGFGYRVTSVDVTGDLRPWHEIIDAEIKIYPWEK